MTEIGLDATNKGVNGNKKAAASSSTGTRAKAGWRQQQQQQKQPKRPPPKPTGQGCESLKDFWARTAKFVGDIRHIYGLDDPSISNKAAVDDIATRMALLKELFNSLMVKLKSDKERREELERLRKLMEGGQDLEEEGQIVPGGV